MAPPGSTNFYSRSHDGFAVRPQAQTLWLIPTQPTSQLSPLVLVSQSPRGHSMPLFPSKASSSLGRKQPLSSRTHPTRKAPSFFTTFCLARTSRSKAVSGVSDLMSLRQSDIPSSSRCLEPTLRPSQSSWRIERGLSDLGSGSKRGWEHLRDSVPWTMICELKTATSVRSLILG